MLDYIVGEAKSEANKLSTPLYRQIFIIVWSAQRMSKQ